MCALCLSYFLPQTNFLLFVLITQGCKTGFSSALRHLLKSVLICVEMYVHFVVAPASFEIV